MDFVSVGMNAASVGDEFRMLLKHVISESSFQILEKVVITSEQGEETTTTTTKTEEKRKRTKKTPLVHVKPLTLNKNPTFIFFTERMITIMTIFFQ